MANFYLDIETTGLDPRVDEILTIQFQELDRRTGAAVGDFVILKAWESSEKDIIEKFLKETNFLYDYAFSFVPTGYNLIFEHNFLRRRAESYGFPEIDILSKPFIDLHGVGILMNGGEFKGSGLNKITGKDRDGMMVPIWYKNKDYDKIIEYVKMETREFIKFNVWLYRKMPLLRGEWDGEMRKKWDSEMD